MLPVYNNDYQNQRRKTEYYQEKKGYAMHRINNVINTNKNVNRIVKKKVSYDYLIILLNKANLDIEYNYAQIAYSLLRLSKLYKLFVYRKQNKNHYYRNNPCFFFF